MTAPIDVTWLSTASVSTFDKFCSDHKKDDNVWTETGLYHPKVALRTVDYLKSTLVAVDLQLDTIIDPHDGWRQSATSFRKVVLFRLMVAKRHAKDVMSKLRESRERDALFTLVRAVAAHRDAMLAEDDWEPEEHDLALWSALDLDFFGRPLARWAGIDKEERVAA